MASQLLSDFLGGSKPRQITRLTSGSGNWVPSVDMARCLVRIQAGGGGGTSNGNGGGGAGAMVEAFMRVPIAGVAYVVGAAAAAAASGNKSVFDTLTATPGTSSNVPSGQGGALGNQPVNASAAGMGGTGGVAGGAGGAGAAGSAPGFPMWVTGNALNNNLGSAAASGSQGGGGDSFFGKGGAGATGTGAAGTGYGSGGGAGSVTGGAGMGGLIEIWDFGA